MRLRHLIPCLALAAGLCLSLPHAALAAQATATPKPDAKKTATPKPDAKKATATPLPKEYRDYSKALAYVKKNKPQEVNLGSVRYKPTQLLSILNAMDKNGTLIFTTTWGGVTFSNTSKKVDLREIKATVSKAELEAIIKVCPQVKAIDNTGKLSPSNDVMIPLMEKYPDIEFDWMINIRKEHYIASNATAYSTFNQPSKGTKLRSKDLEVLKYCKNLKALDLGHNAITSLSFLKYCPDMEFLILSENKITSVKPLKNLKHLKYLEIFTNQITDISALEACTELLDLNICNNPILDLKPLEKITTLERLWANHCQVKEGYKVTQTLSDAQIKRFKKLHPSCQVDFTGPHPTCGTWRFLKKGYKHPRYEHYLWCLRNGRWIPFDQPLPTRKNK